MKSADVVRSVVKKLGLVVTNLGYCSRELYSISDSPRNFYMLGSMGLASSIGLGLALSQDRPVYVLDGDASLLMNLGSLSTVGKYAPSNFYLIVIDNESHESTGGQPSHTSNGTDLARIAMACATPKVALVRDTRALKRALALGGPWVIIAKTDRGRRDLPMIPYTARQVADRFIKHLSAHQ